MWNFAVHLPMIGRWFGTHHMPEGRWPDGYGIAGEQCAGGLGAAAVLARFAGNTG